MVRASSRCPARRAGQSCAGAARTSVQPAGSHRRRRRSAGRPARAFSLAAGDARSRSRPKDRSASPWNGGVTMKATRSRAIIFASRAKKASRVWLYREGLYGREMTHLPDWRPKWYRARPVCMTIVPFTLSDSPREQLREPVIAAYAELAVTTNFSFLRGASHPEELVKQAKRLGLSGIGIADRNSVAGVVRAHVAGREWRQKEIDEGLSPSPFNDRGRRASGFRRRDTPDILAYPQDRAAWGRLTRLLSLGKLRAEKGDCLLGLPDLLEFIEGLNLIVMPPARIEAPSLGLVLGRLKEAASRNAVWLGAAMLYRGDDARRLAKLAAIACDARCPAHRRERCALSRARTAGAAGCRHLHPRARHHRQCRPAAGSQCRAASQSGRRKWRGLFREISGCHRRNHALSRHAAASRSKNCGAPNIRKKPGRDLQRRRTRLLLMRKRE